MWMKFILLVLLVLAVAGTIGAFCGASRWRAATRALHARMESARVSPGITAYDAGEVADLPAPVQRYFRAVLTEGQPLVRAVTVEHTGTFNMSDTTERWRPFTSTQRVLTRRPGFVWDARIRMMPGMSVFVHDAYVAGEGVLQAKVLGLPRVMKMPSTPELAHGELMRFFAEAAWYPTALLPSQGVRWEAIDDSEASATLSDGATTVKLVFRFDAEGLISSVRSDGRHRLVDGVQVATPWQGRFWDYERHDGMRMPREGEVAWLLPEGPHPYWRGRIRRIEYEFTE